jgi:hypothetical protein
MGNRNRRGTCDKKLKEEADNDGQECHAHGSVRDPHSVAA